MDPEAILDVQGRTVIVRVHEGSREPSPDDPDRSCRNVIVEIRGLRGRGDEGRASLLSSAISSAGAALGCGKPICIPPSGASGTMTCSIRACFSDFPAFASEFLQGLEAELVHRSRPRGGILGFFSRGGR